MQCEMIDEIRNSFLLITRKGNSGVTEVNTDKQRHVENK